jgi:hypothetical protein
LRDGREQEDAMRTEDKITSYVKIIGFADWNSFDEIKNRVLEFCKENGIRVGEKRNKLIDDAINGLSFKAWEWGK